MLTLITKFAIDFAVTMTALFTTARMFTTFVLSTFFHRLSELPAFRHCSGYSKVL